MKPTFNQKRSSSFFMIHTSLQTRLTKLVVALATAATLVASQSAQAGNGTWLATPPDANWSNTANWSGGIIGGGTGGTTDSGSATFLTNTNGNGTTNPIVVDSGRNLKSINFGSATVFAAAFTIGTTGGPALALTNGGNTTFVSGALGSNTTETINAPLILEPASATTAGNVGFVNNQTDATDTMVLGGAITGGTTSVAITFSLKGTNTGSINSVNGSIGDGFAGGGVTVADTGTATWVLGGTNTYTGATTVNAAGAVLIVSGTGSTNTGAFTVTNGTLVGIGTNTFGNTSGINLAALGTLSLRGDSDTSFTKTTSGTGDNVSTTASGATINVDQATVAGTGPKTMTIGTVGTTSVATTYQLNFTGANSTSLSTGAVTGTASGGVSTDTISNAIASPGTLTIASYTSANTSGGETLTFIGNGYTKVTGAITPSATTVLGVKQNGAGTLELAGASTYTGATTISAGKLRVTNLSGSATGTGAVNNSGGVTTTLAGTGFSSGLLTVTAGSRIAPGVNNSGANGNFGVAGTLNAGTSSTTGGVTLTSAHLDFDLADTAAGTSDRLAMGGVLTLTTSDFFTFNELITGTLEVGVPYPLITGASSTSGFSASATSLAANTSFIGGNYTPTYSLNGTELDVTFAAVPEPGTWVMLVGGLSLLLAGQRFRRGSRK